MCVFFFTQWRVFVNNLTIYVITLTFCNYFYNYKKIPERKVGGFFARQNIEEKEKRYINY